MRCGLGADQNDRKHKKINNFYMINLSHHDDDEQIANIIDRHNIIH
jgi:hypothetical protein